MITVKKLLQSVVDAGMAEGYKITREKSIGMTWSEPRLVGANGIMVSNETYGRESHVYFRCSTKERAIELFAVVSKAGASPHTNWNGGLDKGNFYVRVSPFKGYHWWE